MAQTFDVTFKYLFRRPQGVLSRMLFGEVLEWPNVELPEVRNPRADLLALSTDGHFRQVELQFNNDSAMPFRMLDYYVGIRRLRQEPLHQTVLYAGRSPLTMPSFCVSATTRHHYTILNLREMDGEELLASDDRTDNGGILGIETELKRRLQDEMIDLLENKVLGPAIRQGLAQGLVQGRTEGRTQGRTEALTSLLRKRLEKRFGPLPTWAQAKLAAATPETLEAWSLQLDDNPTLENLLAE